MCEAIKAQRIYMIINHKMPKANQNKSNALCPYFYVSCVVNKMQWEGADLNKVINCKSIFFPLTKGTKRTY